MAQLAQKQELAAKARENGMASTNFWSGNTTYPQAIRQTYYLSLTVWPCRSVTHMRCNLCKGGQQHNCHFARFKTLFPAERNTTRHRCVVHVQKAEEKSLKKARNTTIHCGQKRGFLLTREVMHAKLKALKQCTAESHLYQCM